MRSTPSAYVLLVLGLGFSLSHCGDDGDGSTPVPNAGSTGQAGEAGEGGSPASAGNGSAEAGGDGVEAGTGGTSGSSAAGGGGEPQGGTGAGASAGGAAGADAAGGACNAAADPGNCCDPEDAPCEEDWELVCYNDWLSDHYCCDAELGVRHSCNYDGDFYSNRDVVCVDECTGKSFGAGSCEECLFEDLPACADNGGCEVAVEQDYCQNASAGYVLSCSGGNQEVVCICDPEL